MAQPLSDFIARLIAHFWNALGPRFRRRLVWLVQPKFTLGVSGLILDPGGRVLLLRHRFWKQSRWGLPGGSAQHGEKIAETLRREVREETGLEIVPEKLLEVRTSPEWRVEFVLLARCDHPRPEVRSVEILEARFWSLEEMPGGLLPSNERWLAELRRNPAPPGLPIP